MLFVHDPLCWFIQWLMPIMLIMHYTYLRTRNVTEGIAVALIAQILRFLQLSVTIHLKVSLQREELWETVFL